MHTQHDVATQMPPNNPEAERAVLGGVLRCPATFDDIAGSISEADFYNPAHGQIWNAMATLAERGTPLDLITVGTLLRERNQVADIGGYDFLAKLVDETPTGHRVEYSARTVRGLAVKRQLQHAAYGIIRDIQANTFEFAEDAVAAAESAVFAISDQRATAGVVPISWSMEKVFQKMDGKKAGSEFAWPWLDLNANLSGFHPGELTIIAARPSVGKTALAVDLARRSVLDGRRVLISSLEMNHEEITQRVLCAQSKVKSDRLRGNWLNAEEVQSLYVAKSRLQEPNFIWIDDAPAQTVMRIAAAARRLKRREGLDLVIVDYIQLVEPDPGKRFERRDLAVGDISRRLKCLAKELHIPVVACCQLNRAAEDHDPRLSDLRESGNLEQDADNVLLLHRPDKESPNVEINIAKQRNGPTGIVTLVFNRGLQCFENAAYEPLP